MRLAELVTRVRLPVPALLTGDPATEVAGISIDSREVTPGALFCCVRGQYSDGHLHAGAAVAQGAVALVVDRPLPLEVPQLRVADVRAAIGPFAAALAGDPSTAMTVVGITGTNGKTTTSQLLATILRAAGWPTSVFGTLTGKLTTPEAPVVQQRFAEARDRGDRAVVMEVSSHALDLHRVDGSRFAVAVFTNLGHDHLDFHSSTERYFAAKARLFTPELSDLAVVNADDVHGRLLLDVISIPALPFRESDLGDVRADARSHSYRWRETEVVVPLGGRFNVANSHAAAVTAEALGIDRATIAAGLAALEPVPGRFEHIDAGQRFDVVVDYSHKPDAMRGVLEAARASVGGGRVIVVFGCGGDRDHEKRPVMGAIAGELADSVVVTSDNPRSEDPLEIIASVLSGVPGEYRRRATSEPDRRAAIALALAQANDGDIVVVAGKGHETTQTIGTTVTEFDDRAVVRMLLENLT